MKIRKVVVHDAAYHDIVKKGTDKMKQINLPAVGHRNNKRLAREKLLFVIQYTAIY